MTANEIVEILKTGLTAKELQSLHANQLIQRPGERGFIQIENMWFLYGNQDERGNISFNGPFDDSGLIYAIAHICDKTRLFKSYEWSNKELSIYLHNHFSSVEEIKEKYGNPYK